MANLRAEQTRWQRIRAVLARIPHPGLNDLLEIAGVALVGYGLSYVHIGVALGAVGLYLVLVANLRSGVTMPRDRTISLGRR